MYLSCPTKTQYAPILSYQNLVCTYPVLPKPSMYLSCPTKTQYVPILSYQNPVCTYPVQPKPCMHLSCPTKTQYVPILSYQNQVRTYRVLPKTQYAPILYPLALINACINFYQPLKLHNQLLQQEL